jgi:hypothetical protein
MKNVKQGSVWDRGLNELTARINLLADPQRA